MKLCRIGLSFTGLVECELRVASYELRVASWSLLRVVNCELRVDSAKCELVCVSKMRVVCLIKKILLCSKFYLVSQNTRNFEICKQRNFKEESLNVHQIEIQI